MTEIADMTDEDLREQLIAFGVNAGPVTSTTRLFYEKKLGKLIDSNGVPAPPSASEEEDEEEEEEEEDEEVQINYRQVHQKAAPPSRPEPVIQRTPANVTRAEPAVPQQQPRTPIIQPRSASPSRGAVRRNVGGSTVQPKPTQSESKNLKESGGGIGMWLKLIFLVVVAVLVYLVIVNMNPSAENKIPLSFDEV